MYPCWMKSFTLENLSPYFSAEVHIGKYTTRGVTLTTVFPTQSTVTAVRPGTLVGTKFWVKRGTGQFSVNRSSG